MAGLLNAMLEDVKEKAQTEVRPTIVADRNSIMSKMAAKLRPSTVGKGFRITSESAKQTYEHGKIAIASTGAKLGLGVGVSKGLAAAGMIAASALTVKTLFVPIAVAGAALGLKKLYDTFKHQRDAWMYDNAELLEHYQVAQVDIMDVLGRLLANGELESLCKLVEEVERARGKLGEEMKTWNTSSAHGKNCGQAVLLAWRYLWHRRLLKEALPDCDVIMHLTDLNRRLRTHLTLVSERIGECGQAILTSFGKHSLGFTDSIAYRDPKRLLLNDGVLQWKDWAAKAKLPAGMQARLANTLQYWKDFVGVDQEVYTALNKVVDAGKSIPSVGVDFANACGKSVVNTVICHGAVPIDAFGPGIITSAVSLPISLIIEFTAKAINDRDNVKRFLGANGANIPIKDRLWLLRSILESGRIKRLNTGCKSLGKGAASLDLTTKTLAGWNAKASIAPNLVNDANLKVRDAIRRAYELHNEFNFCLGLARWTRMMVETVMTYMGGALDEFDALTAPQVEKCLQIQITGDHKHICKGTCYGTEDGGTPIYPLDNSTLGLNPFA